MTTFSEAKAMADKATIAADEAVRAWTKAHAALARAMTEDGKERAWMRVEATRAALHEAEAARDAAWAAAWAARDAAWVVHEARAKRAVVAIGCRSGIGRRP
jgi:hypothetical protein